MVLDRAKLNGGRITCCQLHIACKKALNIYFSLVAHVILLSDMLCFFFSDVQHVLRRMPGASTDT